MSAAGDKSDRGGEVRSSGAAVIEPVAPPSDFYLEIARRLIAERAQRTEFIDAELVGEPAWDILLAAYVAAPGVPRSVVEACTVGGIPFLAGFRWFKVLEGADLVQRTIVANDDYAQASLTPRGRSMLESYFDTISAPGATKPG